MRVRSGKRLLCAVARILAPEWQLARVIVFLSAPALSSGKRKMKKQNNDDNIEITFTVKLIIIYISI